MFTEKRIREIDAVRHTDKSLWISSVNGKEKRISMRSQWDNYFHTYDDAFDYVHSEIMEDIRKAKIALKRAEDNLSHLISTENPASQQEDPQE